MLINLKGMVSMMKILEYIESFIDFDNDYLDELHKQNTTRKDIQPSVGIHTGKMLGLLIRLIGAKRVLELGTCIGYSAVWLGEALKSTGGELITVEFDKNIYNEARENIEKAGLSSVIEIIYGDAFEIANQLDGKFDMILQDSAKALYPEMLEQCIALTRKNGLIIADDTLFKPMGLPDKLSDPMHEYNKIVFADERLYSTILPIGDGATISIKLCD